MGKLCKYFIQNYTVDIHVADSTLEITVITLLMQLSFSNGRKLRYQHFEDIPFKTSQMNKHAYHNF